MRSACAYFSRNNWKINILILMRNLSIGNQVSSDKKGRAHRVVFASAVLEKKKNLG